MKPTTLLVAGLVVAALGGGAYLYTRQAEPQSAENTVAPPKDEPQAAENVATPSKVDADATAKEDLTISDKVVFGNQLQYSIEVDSTSASVETWRDENGNYLEMHRVLTTNPLLSALAATRYYAEMKLYDDQGNLQDYYYNIGRGEDDTETNYLQALTDASGGIYYEPRSTPNDSEDTLGEDSEASAYNISPLCWEDEEAGLIARREAILSTPIAEYLRFNKEEFLMSLEEGEAYTEKTAAEVFNPAAYEGMRRGEIVHEPEDSLYALYVKQINKLLELRSGCVSAEGEAISEEAADALIDSNRINN